MAAETGEYVNEISKLAARIHIGYGEAAGQFLNSGVIDVPYAESSVLARCVQTPHSHHHSSRDWHGHSAHAPRRRRRCLGIASHYDFRLFSALVKEMHPGGVYLNWGSAVLLPEVFLKAVSVVRNLGVPLRPITTANFDFVQHYRPLQNVVKRPTASAPGSRGPESRGYAITGHHEIMLPLVAAALASNWPKASAAQMLRAGKDDDRFRRYAARCSPTGYAHVCRSEDPLASSDRVAPLLDGDPITYAATLPPAGSYSRDAAIPEDLRISWSWPHLILFLFFASASFVVVQTALFFYYGPASAHAERATRTLPAQQAAIHLRHKHRVVCVGLFISLHNAQRPP